ncbi:MAG TPA: hypothetical protein VIM33_04785 [Gaiellaceae bacterium]|jgi:hypothetical protein
MESNSPLGRHKVAPESQSGDVDETGQIVDLADVLIRRARAAAGLERLAAAICDESAIDVDVNEHLARVAAVVQAWSRP